MPPPAIVPRGGDEALIASAALEVEVSSTLRRRSHPRAGCRATPLEPEDRHRLCWYSRRTTDIPDELSVHTVIDGQLLYCAHPMHFPVVGYEFDVRNCIGCDCFRPLKPLRTG